MSRSVGFADLPSDVATHHVFFRLPISSLVSGKLVCSQWHKIISQRKGLMPTSNKTKVLAFLYAEGISVQFLEWFEKYLRFPAPPSAEVVDAGALTSAASSKITSENTLYNNSYLFHSSIDHLIVS
jgi:hypothetical protein